VLTAQSSQIGANTLSERQTIVRPQILIEKTPYEKLQESIKNLEERAGGLRISTGEDVERQLAEFEKFKKRQVLELKKPIKRRIRKFGRSAKARKRLHIMQTNPPRP